MNWNAIAAIGELSGAVAVVISLLYLARQISQNTRAMRRTAAHEAVVPPTRNPGLVAVASAR